MMVKLITKIIANSSQIITKAFIDAYKQGKLFIKI
jgi:hypothetical protein